MPLISVITAVYDPVPEYLRAAFASFAAQDNLPEGWSCEWVIQEDGDTGAVRELLPQSDPMIRVAAGRRAGSAATRNLALARAGGSLIRNLDYDDILTPGALARDIEVLERHRDVHWTTSRVLDLLPDGSTIGFDAGPPPGKIDPGVVLKYWREHDYCLHVHPTTLCIRRPLAVALGGWMGLPASVDTGLLIAANAISTGYFRSEVGLLYRKWPGQMTANVWHTRAIERDARIQIIGDRADALAALWSELGDLASRSGRGPETPEPATLPRAPTH